MSKIKLKALKEVLGQGKYKVKKDKFFIFIDNDFTEITDLALLEKISNAVTELEAEYKVTEYQRLRKYPSVGEQLGMLFDTIKAGGQIDKDCEWFKAIQAEKDRVPKT